jgi:hypothetical protein
MVLVTGYQQQQQQQQQHCYANKYTLQMLRDLGLCRWQA